jgi:site-specific DNA recombinase
MKRILGLARVSTVEQAENSHALEQQTKRLWDAGCTKVVEERESGASKKRETLKTVIAEIEAGLWDEVVFTRLDRLSRSLTQIRDFAELCNTTKVNLRFLDQQIDLSTPHGRLMLNMLGSVAEWELDLLKSRVNAGLKHFRATNRAHGVVPFGFLRADDRYAPNHSQYRDTGKTCWEVAREIVDVFLEVQTIRGTARIMGERYGARANRSGGIEFSDFPRENGLKYWLQSPVLRGHLGYYYRTRNKTLEIVADQHDRLISEQESFEIDQILSLNRRGERDFAERMPLAGLIYCELCEQKARAFRYHKKHGLIVRWYCSGTYAAPPTCQKSPGIRNELLEDFVISELTARGEEIAGVACNDDDDATVPDSPEILQLINSLNALEALPASEVILEARSKLRNQIESLRSLTREQSSVKDLMRQELVETTKDPGFWHWLDPTSKRRLFRRFVKRVSIADGKPIGVDFQI